MTIDYRKPMLAADIKGDLTKLKYPVLVSPKIDGIRCLVIDGKAVTRSLKPQPNAALRALLSNEVFNGLDGELVVPGETFQETTSRVMGRSNEPEGVEWHVFDDMSSFRLPFKTRLASAMRRVQELRKTAAIKGFHGRGRIHLVEHFAVDSPEELMRYEADKLAQGYEGVMIRSFEGEYKFGRSTVKEGGLLKLKRFTDAEAIIVGFEERMHNTNEAQTNELGRTKRSSAQAGKVGTNTLGAFVLELPDGTRFNCGSGLNDQQRAMWWGTIAKNQLLGKTVKFKYQEHGTDVAPRSPIFLGLRDARDL